MRSIYLVISMAAIAATGKAASPTALTGRTQTTQVDKMGDKVIMIYQSNPSFGIFESKVTDKTGRLVQWYQHFVDGEGKEIINIVHSLPSDPFDNSASYGSIDTISTYTYNSSKNVSEEYVLNGDGTFKSHTIYKYDLLGDWLRGDEYDSAGKLIGSTSIPPEAHLYGRKHE